MCSFYNKAAVVLAIYEYQMVCVISCQLPFPIRRVVPGRAAHPDFVTTLFKPGGTDYAHLIKVWVFCEGHKIWKKSSLYFWHVCRVLCAQQRTCLKVDEDFSKQMWSSSIIQTLLLSPPDFQNFRRSCLSWNTFILYQGDCWTPYWFNTDWNIHTGI